jgi:hypothetical protein
MKMTDNEIKELKGFIGVKEICHILITCKCMALFQKHQVPLKILIPLDPLVTLDPQK